MCPTLTFETKLTADHACAINYATQIRLLDPFPAVGAHPSGLLEGVAHRRAQLQDRRSDGHNHLHPRAHQGVRQRYAHGRDQLPLRAQEAQVARCTCVIMCCTSLRYSFGFVKYKIYPGLLRTEFGSFPLLDLLLIFDNSPFPPSQYIICFFYTRTDSDPSAWPPC